MSTPDTWLDALGARLDTIRSQGRWRSPRCFDAHGPVGVLTDRDATGPGIADRGDGHHSVVSFASNDYLGLSVHPAVVAAAHSALDRWGAGAGASRLVVGDRPVHHDLEEALADWKHTEGAVLFPTGFAANLGVLTALAAAAPGTSPPLLCSDELNHASLIDGARLARAEVAVYPHNDLDALDTLLAGARTAGRGAIVASDTVFSMDGDQADAEALVALAARHGALTVLDEAHAVFGPDIPDPEPGAPPVVRVGTLSKTLGALGGFAASTTAVTHLLVNSARSYIFTTALAPADAAAALAALGVLRSREGADLFTRLRRHVDKIRPGHPSPIVPIVLGDEARAVAAADALLAQGLFVPAIRPPTVAPGSARLRVTLSAAHTSEQVAALATALAALTDPDGKDLATLHA